MRDETLTRAVSTIGMSSSVNKGALLDEFKEFVRTDTKAVIGFATRLMGNKEAGRDLTQDALIKAFKHLDGFRGESSLKTWVMKITVNEGLKRLRRRRLKEKVATWFMAGDGYSPHGYGLNRSSSPEHNAELSEQASLLDKAMQTLPDRQRTVFLLRYIEDLSVAQIAQVTGIGQGTVKTHLVRALRKIRANWDYKDREDENEPV